MTEWNFDMLQAPRGHYETASRETKDGKKASVEIFIPCKVILADKNSDTVTVSRWIPKQNRWNMFTEKSVPLAWKLWPRHPHNIKGK